MPENKRPPVKQGSRKSTAGRAAPRSRSAGNQAASGRKKPGQPARRSSAPYNSAKPRTAARKPAQKRPVQHRRPDVQQPPSWYNNQPRVSRPIDRNARRPEDRNTVIREVQHKRKRKHKRNYTLYYIMLFLFLSVTGLILSLTVFFRIETIEITGSSVYAEKDVLPLLSIQKEDNLLRINTGRAEDELLQALPQADRVSVTRDFPSGIRIEIADGIPSAQLTVEGKFLVVSQSGRILQKNPAPRYQCGPVLQGVSLRDVSVGDYVKQVQLKNWEEDKESARKQDEPEPEKPEDLENLEILFTLLKKLRFTEISAADVTDPAALTIYWQNRLEIRLGSFSELEYKLRFVQKILTDEEYAGIIQPEQKGILDAHAAASLLPFQPVEELVVPGGGCGSWNWFDSEARSQNQDGDASEDSEASEPSGENKDGSTDLTE